MFLTRLSFSCTCIPSQCGSTCVNCKKTNSNVECYNRLQCNRVNRDDVLCCVVLQCAMLCCVVLCCVVLCCVVLCCAVLFCVVLCCVVLCSAFDTSTADAHITKHQLVLCSQTLQTCSDNQGE